jgi:hypothetical protein
MAFGLLSSISQECDNTRPRLSRSTSPVRAEPAAWTVNDCCREVEDGRTRFLFNPFRKDQVLTYFRSRHFDLYIDCRDDHVRWKILAHCPGCAGDRAPNHKSRASEFAAEMNCPGPAPPNSFRYLRVNGSRLDVFRDSSGARAVRSKKYRG